MRHRYEKYRLLGTFADSKPSAAEESQGSGLLGEQIGDCFHLRSRDLVTSTDRRGARAAYVEQVCLCDAGEVGRQLETGICFRNREVQRVLREMEKEILGT